MHSDIQISNNAEVCSIDIEGTIGLPEAWQFENPDERVATYEKFREALQRIAAIDHPQVVVNIRSTGGDVNDALLIYEALTALPAQITTRCYGYTASAATIIAQAASEGCREVASSALYLIHNAVCAAEGNTAQMERNLELLRKTDERLAGLYAARSGRTVEQITALMAENDGNGRWLSPQEAVEAGLADRVADSGRARLVQNLVRRWNKWVGKTESSPLPEDRNILHPERLPEVERQSAAALQQAQERFFPTATKSKEDPSATENSRTPNEHAYADDARRFGKF